MIGAEDAHVRLLDDARQAAATADRTVRRLLCEADEQDASFRGSIEGLAEAGPVILDTVVGRRLRGTVRTLAAQHVVLIGAHGTAWLRIAAITTARPAAGHPVRAGGGDRPAPAAVSLPDALRVLVERRATLEVLFDGAATVRGRVLAVGRDVLTLREPAGQQLLVHLDRAAVLISTDG